MEERRACVCVSENTPRHVWTPPPPLPKFSSVWLELVEFETVTVVLELFCLDTFESFLLMQGTIKLSNGHNHYVKRGGGGGAGGLYCQQFEHCLLPGSADEMSGAQYFKAINLSAFLFSLITF